MGLASIDKSVVTFFDVAICNIKRLSWVGCCVAALQSADKSADSK
jgi:hypothetical protein